MYLFSHVGRRVSRWRSDHCRYGSACSLAAVLVAPGFAPAVHARVPTDVQAPAIDVADTFASLAQGAASAFEGTVGEGVRLLAGVWRNWPWSVLLATLPALALCGLLWRRRALRRSSADALRAVLNALPDAAAVFDVRGRLTVANEHLLCMMPGGATAESLFGTTSAELYAKLVPDDIVVERSPGGGRGSTANPATNLDFELPGHGRRSLLVRERAHGEDGLLVSICSADRHHDTRFRDPLTSLPNRASLIDALAQLCEIEPGRRQHARGVPAGSEPIGERATRPLALIIIDLKSFRQINDTYGRSVGDRVLEQTAVRLRESMPPASLIARTVGNEFAVLVELDAATDARQRVERSVLALLDTLRRGLDAGTVNVPVRASVGVAYSPDHGRDVASLTGAADSACAHAKRLGENALEVYSFRRQREAKHRHRLEVDLQKAIERHELSLQYQPQVDVRTKMTCGMEALLRWQHPEFGQVSPASFIPIAEQSGIINRLGSWVIREAIDDSQRLARFGMSPQTLSINLSRKQFDDGRIVREIGDLLERTGFDPGRLCLEITETALFGDVRHVHGQLASLSGFGARLAIDDFGAGYSSLLELKELPIGEVKIDRAFVTDVVTNGNSQDIIGAIVSVARSVGADVVAEGIEDRAQFEMIAALGCDRGQGHWLCEPMAATAFPDVVLGN